MKTSLLLRFCLSFCLLTLGSLAQAKLAPALLIDSTNERLELAPWLDIASPTWQALDQAVLAKGYVDHPVLLRLKIDNQGLAKRRILEFTRANLGRIEVTSQNATGQWITRRAGANELLPRGDINGLGYSFELDIPEGKSEIFFRLSSSYPMATPIRLSTENALFRAAQNSAGIYGAGLGLLGGILLGIVGLRSARLSIPTRWFLFALLLTVILRALADRGVLGYWWLDIPGSLHGLIQISSSLLSMAHLLLCHQFLAQRQILQPAGNRLLWLVVILNLLWMLNTITQTLTLDLVWSDGFRIISIAVILSMLWLPMRQKVHGAKLYFAITLAALCGQLYNDGALRGWVKFIAEPYQLIIVWHLLAAPLLLHALEQPAPITPPVRRSKKRIEHTMTERRPATQAMTSSPLNSRVLVVEDNPWVQQVLTGLLLKLGCQPSSVNDGLQALDILKKQHFDLVLMDCDLPGLDGISTAQLWRAEAAKEAYASAANIPIVAITAHVSAAYETQAREAGMNDFLQKPIDMRTLHELLQRWSAKSGTTA